MTEPLLSHSFVQAEGATPKRWMLVLHGVFGMGINFRTFCKGIAQRLPEWGFVLVDLRGHGTSQGFPPPHTLAQASEDVHQLAQSIDRPVAGILGHSFGGKVALSYLDQHPGELSHALVLDSVPGITPPSEAPEGAERTLAFLESISQPIPSREAFALASAAHGHAKGITEWLAMNVRAEARPNAKREEGEGFVLRLDLPAIRALLVDYHATDLWKALSDRSVTENLTLVVGGASKHFSVADLERARSIVQQNRRVHLEVLAGAGHWLHVDEPRGLSDIVVRSLTSDAAVG